MQEPTNKEQDFSKGRRSNPVHVVENPRGPAPNADALREVHMSLVRAEQNLYNLVQANHAANGTHLGPASFGFTGPQAFAPGYATAPGHASPSFAPGFAPTSGITTPNGMSFGTVPGLNPWGVTPQAAISAWSPLTATIAAAHGFMPTTLAPGAIASAFTPTAFVPTTAAFGVGVASRTPACDISDEGKQFVCLLDLPGLKTDQVELLCFENAVIVNAYREADGDIASLVQSERGSAMLQRTITLPTEIQPGGAKATLSNGVLTVVLPKVHPTEAPRRIKIQG